MKILLAEDENDLREVVHDYLEYQGHTVRAVPNGQEALKAAAEDAFDVILMDIMMPVMDGLTAMRALRERGDTTPAVFLTAKGEVADRVEGLDAGADDYLTKPFALEELGARLRAMNRRKRDYQVRVMSWGNMELDTESSELRAHNSIGLSQREVKLMSLLLNGKERSFTTGELLREVWGGEEAREDAVWMYITFLRAKLQSIQADCDIEGERGGSFRLVTAKGAAE